MFFPRARGILIHRKSSMAYEQNAKLSKYWGYHAAVWPGMLDIIRQCNMARSPRTAPFAGPPIAAGTGQKAVACSAEAG
jgi:hypothetical protein